MCVALGLALVGSGARAFAQDTTSVAGRCAMPDSVAILGNHRVSDADVRGTAGLVVGSPVNARTIQDAVKNLFETGQFSDVQITCKVAPTAPRSMLVITVTERPQLDAFRVTGEERLSEKTIRSMIDLTTGRPVQAGDVTRAVTRIDSAYQNVGYYLARVKVDTATTDNHTVLTFNVDEGHRLAIAGIRFHGNTVLSDREIVRAMRTKPEAFPFWRKGDFDADKFAADLAGWATWTSRS
jgi:outer membrane protein insertion porin family